MALHTALLMGCFALASGVEAQAITKRDGTMQARTGVKLSMSPLSNPVGDHVVAMGTRVQRAMPGVRQCYGRAVTRHPSLEGKVEFRLEAGKRGAAKVWVTHAGVEHKKLARCFASALRSARMNGIPARAAAKVRIEFQNSRAAGADQLAMRAAQARRVDLRRERDGSVSSNGGTQGGEVQFQLRSKRKGSRATKAALTSLHTAVADRLAGLLDCRRRAARRGMRARGALVFEVQTGAGEVRRVRTVSSQLQDPRAPQCVKTWLAKAEPEDLKPGRVLLTLQYD